MNVTPEITKLGDAKVAAVIEGPDTCTIKVTGEINTNTIYEL